MTFVVRRDQDNQREGGDTMAANVGDKAPDFTLTSPSDEKVSLSDFRAVRHVALSFHIFNFTTG